MADALFASVAVRAMQDFCRTHNISGFSTKTKSELSTFISQQKQDILKIAFDEFCSKEDVQKYLQTKGRKAPKTAAKSALVTLAMEELAAPSVPTADSAPTAPHAKKQRTKATAPAPATATATAPAPATATAESKAVVAGDSVVIGEDTVGIEAAENQVAVIAKKVPF
jgi:uncharacterized membrane protein